MNNYSKKKVIGCLCVLLAAGLMLAACGRMSLAADGDGGTASLPDTVSDSYYAGRNDPAYEYFQHSSIQRFLAMWVKEETGDIGEPVWDLDTFTKISLLDHGMEISDPDETLYYCTFSDGDGRYGYVIFEYHEKAPSITNRGVRETTPYRDDLRAEWSRIEEELKKTEIDLETAEASRVCLYDKDNKRPGQGIRFVDGKGGNYFCYLGDDGFTVEKW